MNANSLLPINFQRLLLLRNDILQYNSKIQDYSYKNKDYPASIRNISK